MNKTLFSLRQITKSYKMESKELQVLNGIDLEIMEGESLCITGLSGAGKSTLLHILGSLERPSSGSLYFESEDLFKRNDDTLARFRGQSMGFVFQFHHLLKEFTALENVMMPCRIAGQSIAEAEGRAKKILEEVGLGPRLEHFPSELSGGEQQRVAIARALVMGPRVLFADEPTGNLDSHNSQNVQELFFRFQREMGLTLVVVSHDKAFARRFPRQVEIRDGLVFSQQ